jgi:aldehyde dehydrogenase (NAD+)
LQEILQFIILKFPDKGSQNSTGTDTSIMQTKTNKVFKVESTQLEQIIIEIFNSQQSNKINIINSSAAERISKLQKIKKWIYQNKSLIREALYADFKKPAPEVDLQEIYVSLIETKHAIRNVKMWMKLRKVKRKIQLPTARGWVEYHPKGVVLIITPWNFPFMLTVTAIVSAIAAGNCMMVKPSELSPITSRLLKEMMDQLFPQNEVAVIEGEKDVATALLKLKFDHILFTGSSEIGKIIMKSAAENLTSVTLELGGKSPAIIDQSANIADAAHKISWGKYINSGQTCVSPDYLFVHQLVYGSFVTGLRDEIIKSYGSTEAERKSSPDFARSIDQKHFDRVRKLIEDASNNGGKCDIGGEFDETDRYIAPTIMTNIPKNSALMKEEIFGPILPIFKYNALEEVLETIKEKENPLSIYIFSKNKKNINTIIKNTFSGGVGINEVVTQFIHANLPFGGVGNSGMGNCHGFYGFKAFSTERAIIKNNRYSPLKLVFPPFSSFKKKLIDIMVRYL